MEQPSTGLRTRAIIDGSPFTIGRQGGNQLVLRDNRVSREHARLVREQGVWWIEDLASLHGLWVNGQRVQRHKLQTKDRIEFGVEDGYTLTFTLEEEKLGRFMDQASGPQNLAKLRSLVEVARAAQRSIGHDDVLRAVVDAALTITESERGFLLLKQGLELDIAVARDQAKSELSKDELTVPVRWIREALETRQELLIMNFDPLAIEGVLPEHTVARLELRSVICVPLVRMRAGSDDSEGFSAAEETVGVLYLDSRLAPANMSAGNPELLQTLALEASAILENARLIEEEREARKLEEEMEIARGIQRSLLPSSLPSEGWFQAIGSSQPASLVGGDYYDVHLLADGSWSIVLADVSGKGASSALLAALLQGAFLNTEGAGLPKLLDRLNRFLLERTQGEKYATVFCGALRPDGVFQYANTGICPPYVLRADGTLEKLEPTSMPLGMLEGVEFSAETLRLAPGDRVLAYSDGVEDATNPTGEAFGKKRLRQALEATRGLTLAEAHESIRTTILAFVADADPADDLTLLLFQFAAPEPAPR